MPRGLKLTGQNYSMGYDMLVRKNTFGSQTIWVDWQWSSSITGSLSKTLDNLSVSSAGKVYIVGTLSKTLEDLSVSSGGKVYISGGLAKTLEALSVSSDGKAYVSGTLAKTLDNVTVGSDGKVYIQCSLAQTLEGLTLVSAGTVPAAGSSATLDVVLANLTLVGVVEAPTSQVEICDEVKTWLLVEDSVLTSIDLDEEVKAIAMTNSYAVDLEVYDAVR